MIQHTISKLLTRIFLATCLFITAFYLSTSTAFAQMPPLPGELEGWAWSGYTDASGNLTGVGWISMSCENDDSCVGATSPGPKVDYGVSIDAGGNLTGYAWASTGLDSSGNPTGIGWIKFGGLSGFPGAGGNARLVDMGTHVELQGWARACAGAFDGDCSSMADEDPTRSGGWDGWISFQGTATDGSPYGVRFTSSGVDTTYKYAWGGEKVVGWVDFSQVVVAEIPDINTFTADPVEQSVGTPTELTWDIQGFDSCAAANDNGQTDWDGTTGIDSTTGVHSTFVNPPLGDTQYTLTCLKGSQASTETVTVTGFADIAINAFSKSGTPAPNPDGTYDNVLFNALVNGLPNGESVDYQLSVSGATTDSINGTVSQVGPVTTFTPPLQMNNLSFGTNDFTLDVDLPAPGSVPEDIASTPIDEDLVGNSTSLNNQFFAPIPPTMSITSSDDFVRAGEAATIDWSVTTPYIANCRVLGAGIDEPFSTLADLNASATGPQTTNPLQSTSVITLTCTEPVTATDWVEEIRVEVVPNVEEI